jgi:CDP-glycerol glycerophosphotransferase (TagB/SpsB family)
MFKRAFNRISRKRGGILKTALYILLLPLYFLIKFIPKNNRLYAFGSCHGLHFADNSKYLFLYASRHVKNIRCVFVSRNKDVVRLLTDNGYNACYTFSLQGLITAVRAKKCFITNSTHDVHTLLIGGAEITQLWHGTPLKAICYDVDLMRGNFRSRTKYFVKGILFKLVPYLNTSMTFENLVVASEHVKKNFRSAFRLKDEDILVLGQARNDCLADDFKFDEGVFPEIRQLEQLRNDANAVITWMPTHRLMSGGATEDLVSGYSFNLQQLEELLEKYNARFVIKVHFLDSRGLRNKFKNCDRIMIYRYADPYPLLRYTDVLVTDYSSVYFDYLLLNRPMIFTPFDYEWYVRYDASFYYDYNEVTPGDKCRNWNEVTGALDRLLTRLKNGERDPYAEQREELCRLFNDYQNDNSRRIVDKLFDA